MLTDSRRKLAQSLPHTRLLILLVLIALGATHCAPTTWNDESRMATVQSLVESGSFVIDQTDFARTGDKVFINGHFYSDKPPMPAVLGAAVYFPLYHLGLTLHEGGSLAYFLITLLTVSLFWILGTLAFFDSLRFTGMDPERRLLAALALGLGTIYFTWSTTFNNHELAAGFLSIGLWSLLKARYEAHVRRDLAVAGFFLALAGAADVPTGIFYVTLLVPVVRNPVLRKEAVFYLLPLLLTLAPYLAINFSIHHSILPVQIVRSYFEYPGSPWIGSDELSGMRPNGFGFICSYALLTLVGPKGFLLYDPFLFVAIWGLVRAIRRREPFASEGIAIAAGSVILLLYYWVTSDNYAGWSYSIRWFVPLLPLLLFFLYPFFENFNSRRESQFQALLCVSVVIAAVGALNPWSPVIYSDVPFIANIKQFVAHLHRPLPPPLPQRSNKIGI
jgi:hypothetical protein